MPIRLLAAVVLLNINGFFDGLRTFLDSYVPPHPCSAPLAPAALATALIATSVPFIHSAITHGFLAPENHALMTFLDKPANAGDDFDWGEAALKAVEEWKAAGAGGGVPYNLQWEDEDDGKLNEDQS